MSLLKSARRTDTVRGGPCALAALYIRVVRAAGRWRVEGGAIPEAFWRERKPFIPTFWHGRLLKLPYCWSWSVPMNMLISGHPDGRLISGAIGHLGLGVIVGSTRRGRRHRHRPTLRRADRAGGVRGGGRSHWCDVSPARR